MFTCVPVYLPKVLMNIDLILFLVLAIVAVAAALGMLLSRNAIYSALFLVLNFGTVAVFRCRSSTSNSP